MKRLVMAAVAVLGCMGPPGPRGSEGPPGPQGGVGVPGLSGHGATVWKTSAGEVVAVGDDPKTARLSDAEGNVWYVDVELGRVDLQRHQVGRDDQPYGVYHLAADCSDPGAYGLINLRPPMSPRVPFRYGNALPFRVRLDNKPLMTLWPQALDPGDAGCEPYDPGQPIGPMVVVTDTRPAAMPPVFLNGPLHPEVTP